MRSMLDRFVVGAVLVLALLAIGAPLALFVGSHLERPKDRKATQEETYPDDHLFI